MVGFRRGRMRRYAFQAKIRARVLNFFNESGIGVTLYLGRISGQILRITRCEGN